MDVNPYESPRSTDQEPAGGKQCPECGRDIGIWRVANSFDPAKVRCPHCGMRVGYAVSWRFSLLWTITQLAISLIFFAVFICLAPGLRKLELVTSTLLAITFLATLLGLLLAAGCVGTVYLRRYGRLIRVRE